MNMTSKHLQRAHSKTQQDEEWSHPALLVSRDWNLRCSVSGWRSPHCAEQPASLSKGNFIFSSAKDLDMMFDKVPVCLVGSQALEAFEWWLMSNSHWAHYYMCKCKKKGARDCHAFLSINSTSINNSYLKYGSIRSPLVHLSSLFTEIFVHSLDLLLNTNLALLPLLKDNKHHKTNLAAKPAIARGLSCHSPGAVLSKYRLAFSVSEGQ